MKILTPLIFIFLFLLSQPTQSQNYNTQPFFVVKKVNFPYLDVGGSFLPTSNGTYNINLGFGYQFSNFFGLGVSYANASSWDAFKDKFNGFGLDYRIQNKTWWVKNTIGFVNEYFPSQKSVFHQYGNNKKNKIYYRLSLGWIPRGSILKIGMAYHLSDAATFETWTCEPGIPDCEFIANQKRRVSNIQIFVGIHLPNPNRKNLRQSILSK